MICSIQVACNDPDNGNFVGKSEFIHLHFRQGEEESELEFEGPGLVTDPKGNLLRVGHLVIPFSASKEWYGNNGGSEDGDAWGEDGRV